MKIKIKDNSDEYDPRFVIADDDGKVIADAQGYGYKSKAKAAKAMWYKFKGGKTKLDQRKREEIKFFKKHKGLEKFLNRVLENNFKEIYRGEITEQDIIDEIKQEFGVDIPKEYLGG